MGARADGRRAVRLLFPAHPICEGVDVRRLRVKLLRLLVTCGAALCGESIFRKWLMDTLQAHGSSVAMQLAASAVTVGALHGIWALMGRNLWAGVGVVTATTILGACLATVYVASTRILLPCIVAHFLIDAAIEPGLVLGGLQARRAICQVIERAEFVRKGEGIRGADVPLANWCIGHAVRMSQLRKSSHSPPDHCY
jgi:hypothetical protein